MSKKGIAIKISIIILILLFTYALFSVYAFADVFLIEPTADQNHTEMFPGESFVIDFSIPINKKYYANGISLVPPTPMQVKLNKDKTKITLVPTDGWKVGQTYKVSIPEGKTTTFRPVQEADFSFKITGSPKVEAVIPEDGTTEVVLGAEDPIKIDFDKSTEGFYIDFALEPAADLEFKNNDEKTSFDILPKESLQEGVEYKLTIKSKPENTSDNNYEELSTTSFTTLPPQPQTWAEKLDERLAQAIKYTQPRIKEGKYIDINLSTQIMTIFEDGNKLGTFLISSGKAGMNTPKGTHQIYNKRPRPWSAKYGLYMPYWMAITSDGGYGIHELPEWPGGYKEGQNHLGIPVSHGCVRLGVGNAKRVYDWADIGTPVIVY